MPLPQQVINQLSREPAETPGWSFGVIFFSAILLAIVVVVYCFLVFVYGPYLNAALTSVQGKIAALDQSIASGDETQLVNFYSQVVNLQYVLANHIVFSRFFDWLAANTEAIVHYTQFSFSSGNQVTLSAIAATEADVNQQIAIFESSPVVQKMVVSNVEVANAAGSWTFSVSLSMDPSVLTASSSFPAAATTTTP